LQISDLLGAFLDKLPVGCLLVIKRTLNAFKKLGVPWVASLSLGSRRISRLWRLNHILNMLNIGVLDIDKAFRFELELSGPWDRKWKILIILLFLTVLDPFLPGLGPFLSCGLVH